ncbi:hypothetical protein XA68_11389 [Ophiocordyceps unilateralis]|uniref:Peroxisomal membrane protein PEX14 n=1 Tax=Ophiocordyceps unilateralis TaxID=268505 RepID=A0A2A9PGY5_OPHUN|nr:hypothetical protein XA68_11389 [Ophiocordyceps unilateralis]
MVDSEETEPQDRSEPSQLSQAAVAVAQSQDHLQVARRFLDDDHVRTSSREDKARFLKSKGIPDDDVQKLLTDQDFRSRENEAAEPEPQIASSTDIKPRPCDFTSKDDGFDRPPVVTYPEFLAKPVRPPPLVTTSRLLDTLYGFAGLATLLFGVSRYYVAPMIDDQTEARAELHATAGYKLLALLSILEKSVSVIPSGAAGQFTHADVASDAEDPSEMFHRDVGTQTSLPVSPAVSRSAAESQFERQADRLSEAVRTLSDLKDQYRSQSDDLEGLRTLLDVVRDDLDSMTYGSKAQGLGGFEMYGTVRRVEPEDEIRKVRDNIRRVKGILLSARSFPSSTR